LFGKNVIDFDGLTDELIAASVSQAQPTTIAVVMEADSNGSASNIVDSNASGSRQSIFISGSGGNPWGIFAGTARLSATNSDLDPHVLIAVFDGASSDLYLDGVAIISNDPGNQTLSGLTVGARHDGANTFEGLVAHVIVFDEALTVGEVGTLNTALANYWDI
jgi:hypothetical protein